MKKDKIKILFFEIFLIVLLIIISLQSKIFSREIISIIVFLYTILIIYFLKRRQAKSIYSKQVSIIMLSFAIIYLLVFYLLGIYFGFYKYPVTFGVWSIFHYIIPISIIIICSEEIRNIFLQQNTKYNNIFTIISMLLIDIIIYIDIYDTLTLNGILTFVGFISFSSIACNLLYNYISIKYGKYGIIIFRLITVLYVYVIPISPDVYLFFRTFLRMLNAYIIYLFLEYSFSQNDYAISHKEKKKNIVNITILVVTTAIYIMLISCNFKYGVLVVGSGSMKGALNTGDAIVYKQYKNDIIEENNIIVFYKNKTRIIHRVIDIRKVNDEVRYYTKGDNNDESDKGYIIEKNIIGISMFKIPYVGYPSIWLGNIFNR